MEALLAYCIKLKDWWWILHNNGKKLTYTAPGSAPGQSCAGLGAVGTGMGQVPEPPQLHWDSATQKKTLINKVSHRFLSRVQQKFWKSVEQSFFFCFFLLVMKPKFPSSETAHLQQRGSWPWMKIKEEMIKTTDHQMTSKVTKQVSRREYTNTAECQWHNIYRKQPPTLDHNTPKQAKLVKSTLGWRPLVPDCGWWLI